MGGYAEARATVTVFGSGAPRLPRGQYEAAHRLGAELARRGFEVCNGGYGGTMEAAARGARRAARPNPYLDEVLEQPDLPARIVCLLRRGDGYVVLPGGTGTLAEIGMMLEFQNKAILPRRPMVFLGEFWRPLLGLLEDESLLRDPSPFRPVEGVELLGAVALAESPEAAARYLERHLPQINKEGR